MASICVSMKLEHTFRFKLRFTNCKTYDEVFETLKEVEDLFFTLRSLGVKKVGGEEDDYHRLEIDTEDQNIIKKLKFLGFAEKEEIE